MNTRKHTESRRIEIETVGARGSGIKRMQPQGGYKTDKTAV